MNAYIGLLSIEELRIGNSPSILLIIVDITERKTLEMQLHRMQRVESVGRLASGIAHDMNNILAPILMAAPLLRLGLGTAETERMLSAIEKSAQRGAALIRQLLLFGRGTDGERRLVDILKILSEVEEIARETFPRNIDIAVHVCNAWPVWGDPSQLHQIILNLWVNARDAMPEGGRLATSVENMEIDEASFPKQDIKRGKYVLVRVADTGTGIPDDVRERMFDPFFTTKALGKGTGLGLSTVLGVVKRHDGFLQVHSEPGTGTRFEIYLPATIVAPSQPPQGGDISMPQGSGETIMVVDDEDHILTVVRYVLASHNYKVVTARNGTEANAALNSNKDVCLVITDLDMPAMGGVAFVDLLRETRPDLRIIVATGVTARSDAGNREAELFALGVTTVLVKPFTADELLHSLHNALTS